MMMLVSNNVFNFQYIYKIRGQVSCTRYKVRHFRKYTTDRIDGHLNFYFYFCIIPMKEMIEKLHLIYWSTVIKFCEWKKNVESLDKLNGYLLFILVGPLIN